MTPQELVAQDFMKHKGYPNLEPSDVQKVDNQPCWYFLYELPEGTLELEVFWDSQNWVTTVTTFTLGE